MPEPTHEPQDVSAGALRGRGPRLSARPIPRRTVLRGAGVVLSLPWLEAMARADVPAAPLRAAWIYVPNGVHLGKWRGEEAERPAVGARPFDALPPLFAPLARHRARLQILRGLGHEKARANGDGPGDPARAAAVFLTGVQPLKTEGRVRLAASADQLAARAVGGATRVRSLVLGVERGRVSGQCDSGYSCAYSGHVSWESETVPAAKETDPRRAFDALFRGGNASLSPEARRSRIARRRSLLDFVRAESKELGGRVSARDRARIDEFETGLRELERQLSFDGAAHEPAVEDGSRPGARPRGFAEHADLLGDVLALAFEADVTRIATLMYGNEGSGRRYRELGIDEGHHALSHHRGDGSKLDAIGRINGLHAETFARFVDRLAETRGEADASVLDRTMLVYGSGIAEGNRHDHHDLPIALCAGSGTGLGGGRTVVFERRTPANDLHIELLRRLGVGPVPLGDGRGPLPGLA
ncbi:MAG: DUF1552 domain-containing protein [Planctomycetota bacterium]